TGSMRGMRRETFMTFTPTNAGSRADHPGPCVTSWGGDGPPISFGIARAQRDHAGAGIDHGDFDPPVQFPALLRAIGADRICADDPHHVDTAGIHAGVDQRIADRSGPAFAKAVTKRMILAGFDEGLQYQSLIRIPSRPRGHELDLLLALRANVCG